MPKLIIVSLQLADRSIKYHLDIIEDVLVKVDKFYFPTDFIMLDMEEDRNVAIGRALIDVEQGKLII